MVNYQRNAKAMKTQNFPSIHIFDEPMPVECDKKKVTIEVKTH